MINKIRNASLQTRIIAGVVALGILAGLVYMVQPGESIQAQINSAVAGDTIEVAAGTYNERLSITKALTVKCVDVHQCIIKGATISGTGAVLDGFYSLNNDSNAGAITVSGFGNVVRNNKIEHSCMAGIILTGANTADGNEIFRSRQCSGTNGPDADGMRGFGDGNVFINNYIHDIGFTENPTAHIDCIQNFGSSPWTNAVIEGNTCDMIDMSVGQDEVTSGIQTDATNTINNIVIRNNVFHVVRGLNIRGAGFHVSNNVFDGENHPKSYIYFASVTNSTVDHNIIYDTATGILANGGVTGSYNIIWNANGKAPRRDSGYFSATDQWQTMDPMLVNPTAGDYHLQVGSPACVFGGSYAGAFPCGPVPITPTATLKTPTPRDRPSPTFTPTVAASSTFTATPSRTPTRTPSRTPSPTATQTPSRTPSPTATQTPILVDCDEPCTIIVR